MKVIVIGAGVIGVTTACQLVRQGFDVTVVEQRSAAAQCCSRANGGFLSPSYCSPWGAPGVPTMAIKSLFNRNAPFRWRPDYSWRQIRWLLSMLKECNATRSATNRRRMLALGQYSGRCLPPIVEASGVQFEQRSNGIIQPCRSAAQQTAIEQQKKGLAAANIASRTLTRQALSELEPALVANVAEVTGALHVCHEGDGRCEIFSAALAEWLQRQGVTFLWQQAAKLVIDSDAKGRRTFSGVQVKGSLLTADAVVVAAASQTPQLLKPWMDVPIYPVKGYSMTAPVLNSEKAPRHAILDPLYQLAIARFDNSVRVSGFADVVGDDDRLDNGRCRQLQAVFEQLYPGAIDASQAQFWAGLRPMTPDGTPIIGATEIDGVYINAGHGTYGWTMSCGSATLITDIISGVTPELDPSDYALARYHHA